MVKNKENLVSRKHYKTVILWIIACYKRYKIQDNRILILS